ncbi:hypothetical protein AX16_003691 [Volvariella volvacea WC 439]|nr:hypothetical protein AX16_003691 [Volvariella volvacea WC 439]
MFRSTHLRPLARCPPYRRITPAPPSYSTKRTPWRQDTTPEPSVFVEENFAKHTVFVLDVFRRFIKFSLIGLFALGATTVTAYEGLHMWVENVELAPETDEEAQKWEWNKSMERWTGDGSKGGTDPGLGLRARHAVRAAWMAQNWGVGYSTAVTGGDAAKGEEGVPGPGGLKVIDAPLQHAEDFIRSVLPTAEAQAIAGALHPETLAILLTRHASTLERLGPPLWTGAKTEYERVWATLSDRGPDAAYVALKLGDLSSRLKQRDDAFQWWSRAMALLQGSTTGSETTQLAVPTKVPSSPFAQRILVSALVSQSAYLASSGQLKQAQALEEQALALLRSIPSPESLAAATAPQALHSLFILQRSSLLSIHLAEVLHALRKQPMASIQWLTSAAESSERVIRGLTGSSVTSIRPGQQNDSQSRSQLPYPTTATLLPVYTKSKSMNKPASGLLRDAQRTAAEAWNLIGILKESQDPQAALKCYERALDWAGTPPDKAGIRHPVEGILESDWNIYLGNYSRLKRLVGKVTNQQS